MSVCRWRSAGAARADPGRTLDPPPASFIRFLSPVHPVRKSYARAAEAFSHALRLIPDKPEALALARRYFDSVEEISRATVTRPGFDGYIKDWRLFACRGFKGYDPQAHLDGY